MIVVADSGSTKTDWRLLYPDGRCLSYTGIGINPLHIAPLELEAVVKSSIPVELLKQNIYRLYFYGAGCGQTTLVAALHAVLCSCFPSAQLIEIHPDLLAAARALFGVQPGLVAVLGTGSSCAVYDGQRIVSTSNSLGYILGDEGGAVDLGKRLLRAYFYKQLSLGVQQRLAMQGLTRQYVLQQVYQSEYPARFLGQFISFILEHSKDENVKQIIYASISDFVQFHVKPLYCTGMPLGIVGSVAYLFSDILTAILEQQQINCCDLVQYPVDRLVSYHISTN